MAHKKTALRKIKQIVLVPHDPSWSAMFQAEAGLLASVFGEEIISIHHAGSTSIEGIKAKPILDFLIIVRDIKKIDEFDGKMIDLGYEAIGENGIPGRRFFTRSAGENRTHNVHVFEVDHPEIERMLNFRDYLRANADEAWCYSCLKESLAKKYPGDIDSYTEGKSQYINDIIRKAQEWRESLPPDPLVSSRTDKQSR